AAGGHVASIAEVVRRRFRRYLAETGGGATAGGARPITHRDLDGGNVGSAAIEGSGDAPDLETHPHRPAISPHTRPPPLPEPPPIPGGPASSRTRRTCWSSTVGKPRSRRRRTCWPSSASPTSP